MKRVLKDFLLHVIAMVLVFVLIPNVFVSATTWQTIPNDYYVYDTMTYNGITTNAYYPKSSTTYIGKYDSDSTYSCAALPVRFFKDHGISIRIPLSGAPSVLDGSGSFVQVSTPKEGDVLRKPGAHWAIVKSVSGNTITLFEQNYYWLDGSVLKAGKNRTITQSQINDGTWVLYRCTSLDNNSNEEGTSTSSSVTISNQSAKNEITDTNAILWGKVAKPSSAAVTKIGICITSDGDTFANGWSKYEAPSKNYVGYTEMFPYYNMNTELHITLLHLKTYRYKFYAVVGGKEYWSPEYTFTTTGSHSYGSWSTTKAATCTEAGAKTRKCTGCSKTENGTINALGHNYSSSYTIDRAATCTVAGSKSKHCSRCSATTSITTISVLGHTYGNDNSCDRCSSLKYNLATIYPDTANYDWYSNAVAYAYGAGIMKGYSNGYFGTSDGIQRQDFLVLLARFDGADLNQYKNRHGIFTDVAKDSYYEAAVNWGFRNGIVNGYVNGAFGVGDMITREQIMTFLYRYAQYKGKNTDVANNKINDIKYTYIDYSKVSDFSKAATLWAIDRGVIKGKTNTTISPQGNAQRCEIAQIMYNIYLNNIF